MVFASTVGAIAGPALVQPSGLVLGSLTFDPLAGPMWSGALLFGMAGLLIVAFLRPDPRDIGRTLVIEQPEAQHTATAMRSLREIMSQPAAWLALTAMVIGQMVMVLVNTEHFDTPRYTADLACIP